MSSHKRLNSVTHSIAHHAVSALSYIHPHLSQACEVAGLASVEIDVLAENSCPKTLSGNSPLEKSLNHLKVTLANILESEGYKIADLSSVKLVFWFYPKSKDHYCSDCKATIKSKQGRVYTKAVNYVGDEIST